MRLERKTREPERAGGTRRYEHRPGNFAGWDAAEARRGAWGCDPTTKCRCVLPLRPLRGRSESGYTAGTPGPLKAPSPLPTVAAEARDAARGGQTRPGGIRTPRCCRGERRHRYRRRGRYCGRRRCYPRRYRRQRRCGKRWDEDRIGKQTSDHEKRETDPRSGGKGQCIPAEEDMPFGERRQPSPGNGGTVDQGTLGEGSR